MNGVVHLRKNALVIVYDEDPMMTIPLRKFSPFLRDDRVRHESGHTTLVHRVPSIAVAVVESSSPLILYFPVHGSSMTVTDSDIPTVCVTDRLVVSLHSDGSMTYMQSWPSSPRTDAAWIRAAVAAIPVRAVPATTVVRSLYTREGIVDHTDLDTFTIDPATSVDFDDAISVDLATQTVYIHIVDIADAALSDDEQAKLRSQCLTLYLANEATDHLLDSATASDVLSLVVGRPRAVITVAMKMEGGRIVSKEIYRSTIVVKHRYNYEEVAAQLQAHTASSALTWLSDLSIARSAQVNYNLTLPSLRFTMNVDTGVPTALVTECTNDAAHSLVATAMIMANLVVSQHLSTAGLVLPNRFHETLRGIPVSEMHVTGDPVVDSFVLVRKFARARYSVDERGHFGLGLTDYVHFTSPMRRYADVLVHNLLAGVRYTDLEAEVDAMNRQSTAMRGLQYLYQDCKRASWIRGRMDAVYEVSCTDVKAVGIQWFLPALSLNGFAHVSTLHPKQRWLFQDDTLVGGSHRIRVGSLLQGRITEIHPVTLAPTVVLIAIDT